MKDPRFNPTPAVPDTELYSFVYVNQDEAEQMFTVDLTIFQAERLQDREIVANVKTPVRIALDPRCDVAYQIASSLYMDGIYGRLVSVTYLLNGQQVTI